MNKPKIVIEYPNTGELDPELSDLLAGIEIEFSALRGMLEQRYPQFEIEVRTRRPDRRVPIIGDPDRAAEELHLNIGPRPGVLESAWQQIDRGEGGESARLCAPPEAIPGHRHLD